VSAASPLKVAVVGAGVAGLVVARELARAHEVDVFEADARIGGHTHTVDVDVPGRAAPLPVDTGFIVFNEHAYPNFCAIMRELGVASKPSSMSFSVRNESTGFEYNTTSLRGLFAQRRNLVRPRFWGMLRDIQRFFREAPALLEANDTSLTLAEFLARGRYGRTFIDEHLLPMGAAVWSARPEVMHEFPALFLFRFFANHGFLQVDDRPPWRVIVGGSRAYIEPLTASYAGRIHRSTPIVGLRREVDASGRVQVRLRTAAGDEQRYDRVVLACHADQARALLDDPTVREREILAAFEYQRNLAVLHTDRRLLPRHRAAWASWNYHVTHPVSPLSTVSYYMNMLQGFAAAEDYIVTLNRSAAIDPAKILRTIEYQHPIYTRDTVAAQARHAEIDGGHAVHFCGAYWGYGFHEDAVRSALIVARNIADATGTLPPTLRDVPGIPARSAE
jgi:predicted NAD/FAD-binding protein